MNPPAISLAHFSPLKEFYTSLEIRDRQLMILFSKEMERNTPGPSRLILRRILFTWPLHQIKNSTTITMKVIGFSFMMETISRKEAITRSRNYSSLVAGRWVWKETTIKRLMRLKKRSAYIQRTGKLIL